MIAGVTPTPTAWSYFLRHRDNIRACVKQFCIQPGFLPEDFDKAVLEQDVRQLVRIMNDAWFRAPEDRAVYRIPGFTAMCDLLDSTVPGFTGEEPDDENTAF